MFAQRLASVSGSATLKAAAEAERLRRAGFNVVDFTAGEPDFPTPLVPLVSPKTGQLDDTDRRHWLASASVMHIATGLFVSGSWTQYQFRGVNAQGFGDYSDGFAPANQPGTQTTPIPGCSVADDFTRALGDSSESRLAAALAYRVGGAASCPAPTGVGGPGFSKPGAPLAVADGLMRKSPARESRLVDR